MKSKRIKFGQEQSDQIVRTFAWLADDLLRELGFENNRSNPNAGAEFFLGKSYALFLKKYGLGFFWGDFFTDSSGQEPPLQLQKIRNVSRGKKINEKMRADSG
jgi:hypothetical protein